MTFNEYEKMIEQFKKLPKNIKPVWPTVEQIDMFETDPEKWLKFACFLQEMNPPPRNSKERYSQRNITAFINHNLELVKDSEEMTDEEIADKVDLYISFGKKTPSETATILGISEEEVIKIMKENNISETI